MAEAHTDQRVTHVEAGSEGRLIRALMKVAREQPEWRAKGPVHRFKNGSGATVLRQRLEREPHE